MKQNHKSSVNINLLIKDFKNNKEIKKKDRWTDSSAQDQQNKNSCKDSQHATSDNKILKKLTSEKDKLQFFSDSLSKIKLLLKKNQKKNNFYIDSQSQQMKFKENKVIEINQLSIKKKQLNQSNNWIQNNGQVIKQQKNKQKKDNNFKSNIKIKIKNLKQPTKERNISQKSNGGCQHPYKYTNNMCIQCYKSYYFYLPTHYQMKTQKQKLKIKKKKQQEKLKKKQQKLKKINDKCTNMRLVQKILQYQRKQISYDQLKQYDQKHYQFKKQNKRALTQWSFILKPQQMTQLQWKRYLEIFVNYKKQKSKKLIGIHFCKHVTSIGYTNGFCLRCISSYVRAKKKYYDQYNAQLTPQQFCKNRDLYDKLYLTYKYNLGYYRLPQQIINQQNTILSLKPKYWRQKQWQSYVQSNFKEAPLNFNFQDRKYIICGHKNAKIFSRGHCFTCYNKEKMTENKNFSILQLQENTFRKKQKATKCIHKKKTNYAQGYCHDCFMQLIEDNSDEQIQNNKNLKIKIQNNLKQQKMPQQKQDSIYSSQNLQQESLNMKFQQQLSQNQYSLQKQLNSKKESVYQNLQDPFFQQKLNNNKMNILLTKLKEKLFQK